MAKRHSQSFKIQAVEKALNRSSHETLAHIADHYGIGYSTLTRWMLEVKQGKLTEEPSISAPKEKRPQDWTAGEKLQAIVDTERLNEPEKGRYCREKGLYTHQIEQWK
jgi:transposase-like protein